MKQYRIHTIKSDPTPRITIPAGILRDLVLRSEENGTSVEVELATRLSRSLERDFEMIEEDNELAYEAYIEATTGKTTKKTTKKTTGGI